MNVVGAGAVVLSIALGGAAVYVGYRNELEEAKELPARMTRFRQAAERLAPADRDLLKEPSLGIGDAWRDAAIIAGIGATPATLAALAGWHHAGGLIGAAIGVGLLHVAGAHVGRHVGSRQVDPNASA